MITVAKEAVKILLNAIRVVRAQILAEKFTGVLAEVLVLFQKRKNWKVVDQVSRVQSFVGEYQAKVGAGRNAFHMQVATENSQISVTSEVILRADAYSEKLQKEREKLSSSIADAKAEVALAETEVAGAQQVLMGYRGRDEEIRRTLQGLEPSKKVTEDNRA